MAGVPPRQILTFLRQSNSNMEAISRTLYNTKAKIIKESLAGRSMIQALLEELGEGGFEYDIEYDQDGRLTHLMFIHPKSIALTRSYPNVFVMDCTYKTNRYKMPLLDIIGMSSFNTSFFSCFIFMQKEEEKDYVWALSKFSKILEIGNHPLVIVSDRELALMNAIKVVFPRTKNLLCVWHIEKNILAKCKRYFEEEKDWNLFLSTWTNLINSSNELLFNQTWQQFKLLYERYVPILNYIRGTWLPYKEYFVDAWTEKYTHFENRVSSRAESAHAMLKRYLQVSTGDFRSVKDKMCDAIDNQFQEIKAKLHSEKIRISRQFCIPFFKELVNHISMFALEKLLQQYNLVASNSLSPVCKGHFMKTMGLPCAHKMKGMKDGVLQLHDIHTQWRIDNVVFSIAARADGEKDSIDKMLQGLQTKYQQLPLNQKENVQRQISHFMNDSTPLILEPTVISHKGHPLSSSKRRKTSSTQRDSSLFEIVTKVRKCSICHNGGHDCRTCPKKSEEINPSSNIVYHSQVEDENATLAIDLNMPYCSSDSFMN